MHAPSDKVGVTPLTTGGLAQVIPPADMRLCSERQSGKGIPAVASNLTRDEARERARLLDVESYRVELDLTGDDLTFGSVTTVSFRCASPGASTFIDLSAPTVHEITLNGARVSPETSTGTGSALDGLAERNELRVAAECAYSRTGEGLHRFTDPADGGVYLYTDLETFDAHRVYACFDQPDLKATFQFEVTAQPGWQVISNMAPAATDVPRARGTTRWAFPPTPVLLDLHHRGRGRPVPRGARRARRHPARHLLPPVAGQLPGPGRDLRGHPAGLRLLPRRRSACATRSASTTSCSCPSSTPGRWRTPAASPSSRTTCSGRG